MQYIPACDRAQLWSVVAKVTEFRTLRPIVTFIGAGCYFLEWKRPAVRRLTVAECMDQVYRPGYDEMQPS